MENIYNIIVMEIQTQSGNRYSYNRQTGEILAGSLDGQLPSWEFAPLVPIVSMPDVDSFILGLTEQCNLRCTYCCYSGMYLNKRSHSANSMSKAGIDKVFSFIEGFTEKRPIRIYLYGGEPLLDYPLVQYTVNRGRELWGEDVLFTISTNGTTLSTDRIDWLVAQNVSLSLSIDGTEPYHNRYRVDVKGEGSYAKVYEALSYIKTSYPGYLKNVSLIMTLASFDKVVEIAEAWHNDSVLGVLTPTMINSLAPNFKKGVDKVEYEKVKSCYDRLLAIYEKHRDWLVLEKLLESCIAYWKERPIFTPAEPVPMATCLPHNTKLYIDSNLQIGVCEKIADNYRIGDVKSGIDWTKVNNVVRKYYDKRLHRCKDCSAVRMCNMCLTAVEHTDEQWDVLCHNEQIHIRAFLYLFCEMTERGLVK